ncbi:MAG: YajQ family cyclic di-GMP-binding protein [Leptospiraceae bacterium]|nr:YajQ family cyclic di-GMP-binding protein [Leptospiraceae bacterium]MDW7976792.1 YajQ family cyclic di-GMP-binding protein [Leptospiraceae bacterium]
MAKEHSFDIVYKIDEQELSNAINQALKEATNRFDFKGSHVEIQREKDEIHLATEDEMKMKSLIDIFQSKLVKRGINLKAIQFGEIQKNISGRVKCTAKIQNGLTQEQIKKINKIIKETNIKVQTRIQGDSLRVISKSIDDLQAVIKHLREQELDFAISFDNYR